MYINMNYNFNYFDFIKILKKSILMPKNNGHREMARIFNSIIMTDGYNSFTIDNENPVCILNPSKIKSNVYLYRSWLINYLGELNRCLSPWFLKYNDEFLSSIVNCYKYNEVDIDIDDIVLDIGSSFGVFSCYSIWKGAKHVYAFEPNPLLFDMTSEFINYFYKDITYSNDAVYNDSLSDKDIDLFFNQPDLSYNHSFISKESTDGEIFKSTKINNITTIDIISRQIGKPIDFIKINVGGSSELKIVEGAKETISTNKPKMAIRISNSTNPNDLLKLIRSYYPLYNFKRILNIMYIWR